MSTPVPDPLCPVCQAALQPTWAACPHCGTPLVWRDGVPVPRPVAVPVAPPAPQIVYVPTLPPPAPKRRSGCTIILGLLGVLLVLGWIGNLLNPTPRTAPAFVTPTPSGASASSKPHLTGAEQTYLNALAAESSELGPLLTQFSTESSAADLFSTDWKLRMAVILAGIQTITDAARHLTAPPTLAAVDTPYQSGIGHLAHMIPLITQGIDQKDPALITQANTELTQGNADIQTATTALRAFMAAHQ